MKSEADERFWSKVTQHGDCWLWTASLRNTYGQFRVRDGKTVYAHRFAYEAMVAPIPAGLVIDHLCRNRRCVNPDHLEPVTHAENTARGKRGGFGRVRDACPQNHPWTPENTYRPKPTHRICRACRRERAAEKRAA